MKEIVKLWKIDQHNIYHYYHMTEISLELIIIPPFLPGGQIFRKIVPWGNWVICTCQGVSGKKPRESKQ